jgi:hypothetical protein
MKRIKVFTNHRTDIQSEIDNWIETVKHTDIISVTPSIAGGDNTSWCIVTILYEDGNIYVNI